MKVYFRDAHLSSYKFSSMRSTFLQKHIRFYDRWDFVFFTLLILLSVFNGESTVFYLIYFFWWNEAIRLLIDAFFIKRNPNIKIESTIKQLDFSSFFLMGIYFVFIVVFFGFIANFDNIDIMTTNMKILFFSNWFFNLNILLVILERILLHRSKQAVTVYFGGFTPNMIILHVSIIAGGVLMFFVVKQHQDIFTPANHWGSVIIVMPFILLKMLVPKFT